MEVDLDRRTGRQAMGGQAGGSGWIAGQADRRAGGLADGLVADGQMGWAWADRHRQTSQVGRRMEYVQRAPQRLSLVASFSNQECMLW